MIVLGIDPSNTRHAWALLDRKEVLGFGRDYMEEVNKHQMLDVQLVVIEMIASYGMAVGSHTFDTCVEIGKLMRIMETSAQDVRRITRVEVKRIVCRSVKASDTNVRAAVIDYFGGPGAIKKGGQLYGASKDVWAALAVAIAASSGEARWYTPVADMELLA